MQTTPLHLTVSIARQRLSLKRGRRTLKSYPVSTSGFGIGTEPGSMKTPTGRFRVAEKIGDGAPPGAVFRSRVHTGEFGTEEMPEDLVQTRILWLEGLQRANANTRGRYIYIHGTNHESTIGRPGSHGCVRMRNADVIDLFNRVPEGTEVRILA